LSETFDDLVGTNDTFIVMVGQPQEEFELLCDTFYPRTTYFQGTHVKRRKGTKAPEWSIPILTNEDPAIFADYARCVYFAIIPKAPAYDEDVHIQQAHFDRLFKLYLLAHKFGDHKAANLVVDEIYVCTARIEEAPKAVDINMVYSRNTSGNPLRAFLCDMTIYGGCLEDWPQSDPTDFDRGFLEDLTMEFMKIKSVHLRSTTGEAFSLDVLERRVTECHYHLHDDSLKCTQPRSAEVAELILSRRAN
jgi:hypothetical protein